ncbi:MAG: hypothetical protein JOZ67_12430 [Gammaproteobacteria bacterium]|nr:hypothetical protein [Gammaproteobacteria bacterium]MBV9695410.1 hypothetical protein [Gammaproteobacteria bacterium]
MGSPAAQADEIVLSETNAVFGTEAIDVPFTLDGSGTVTLHVWNIAWPTPLTALTVMASTATQVIGSWDASNSLTQTFSVSGPGTYYAHLKGTAGGALDLGLYSISMTFQPTSAPVPLPESALLLGATLLILIGVIHTRRRILAPAPGH